MSIIHVNARPLRAWTEGVFRAVGVAPASAARTAEVLSYADLRGIDTHGVANLERVYVHKIEAGTIDVAARPVLVVRRGAVAVLDGRRGLGPPAAARAMHLAVRAATRFGVGATTLRGGSHFGAAGYYSRMAARTGMIGLAATNLGTQAIAPPPGGRRPLLGTNPISLAAPAGELPFFVLDMSTTVAAGGKVREAARRGARVPAGWLADAAGRSVTDPRAYLDGTAFLQFAGGVKGYGLAVLVEVLAGVLAGAAAAPVSAGEDDGNVGHFFLALDPVAFGRDHFTRGMDRLLGSLLDCPPADPDHPVTYAGHREHQTRRARLVDGVPLDGPLYDSLAGLGHRLNLGPPPEAAIPVTRGGTKR